jgi:ubiquinone/menaquinone biosynthesis C-methylase UbiE
MLSGLRRTLPLGARADAEELLDSGDLSSSEVAANLADLARLNRLPGGTQTSARAIATAVGQERDIRILDVGTGRGDMPLAFARRGWTTVGTDTNPEVLGVARRATSSDPLVEIVEGDARALPFDDAAFDVAHCSLLVHHLDPHDATLALRELRRVSRRGVVVNDLRRGLIPFVVTGASVVALGRSRVTRTDGLASVRRAYTVAELDHLLERAGLAPRWRSIAWLPRVVTLAGAS